MNIHVHYQIPMMYLPFNPTTFGTFFIQVDAPFETIRYCGFEMVK